MSTSDSKLKFASVCGSVSCFSKQGRFAGKHFGCLTLSSELLLVNYLNTLLKIKAPKGRFRSLAIEEQFWVPQTGCSVKQP